MNINFTLIAQAITFAIFIWFTVKFVWPPLLNAIEKRQKEIADGLAAAQEGKLSLEVAAKKNVETLNEVKQKGAEIVREMIKNADVFLTNVRPQSLESAKLDYESLSKINPKLVYCSLTGYGLDGDDKDFPSDNDELTCSAIKKILVCLIFALTKKSKIG